MSVIKMTDLDLAGKRVFIRSDLNVPVKDGKVTSDARIRASLPTIEAALKQGAKVMVTSHLGRPTEGEYNEEFSLQPVVDYLADKMDYPVRLVKDYLNGVEIEAGELVVLENVRFNKGEKKDDETCLNNTLHCVMFMLWTHLVRLTAHKRQHMVLLNSLQLLVLAHY
ncbi:Phosphoglycerate kinase [Providencia rettgeri]|uniref:Phosphoglycerate kinase n=1 Tax=Providencia rettgeri TaxID=587 RepID=A0A379FMK3_PRORE|nr:Phosphoglycerate kinase [Providencia rettgeri]